jgi:hypothetical protein
MAEERAPREPRDLETRKDETRESPGNLHLYFLIPIRKMDGSSDGYEHQWLATR